MLCGFLELMAGIEPANLILTNYNCILLPNIASSPIVLQSKAKM